MALPDGPNDDPFIEHAVRLSTQGRARRGRFLLRGGAETDGLDRLREAVPLLTAGGLLQELPVPRRRHDRGLTETGEPALVA